MRALLKAAFEPHVCGRNPPAQTFKARIGHRYEVARDFIDFDGATHRSGESWIYLGHAFLAHDDGLSLFVSLDDDSEWHIRLRWRSDQQGAVIDGLNGYIQAMG
jgi:hypothetical protein